MFFTWSGKGYMVPLSAALSTIGLMVLTSQLGIEIEDQLFSAMAAIIAGILVWTLHSRLAEHETGLSIVDDETGEATPMIEKHDFYWVPIKYWGIIFILGGIVAALDHKYHWLV